MSGITLVLTDGNGVGGLNVLFGAVIQSNVIQTANDASSAAASAQTAVTQAANAANSATAASGSATAASNSASSASASASAASGSASAASGSAGSAASSATNAGNSATAAAASATSASNSASAASTSASSASNSATSASTSAANAAATLANALTKANNLSDVASPSTALSNIGGLAKTSNLSDIANAATALANLGGLAKSSNLSDVANAATALGNLGGLAKASNLSDVANTATAASNLGLGTGSTPQFTGIKLSGSTVHGLLVGEAGGAVASLAPVAAGNLIVDQGPTADPASVAPSAVIGVVSGRNRIINGGCRVYQYAASVAVGSGTTAYGGPDRFCAINGNSAGGQFTQSKGTIVYGGVTYPAVVQTVNTAISSQTGTNYWGGITQRIEGNSCYDMLGQGAMLSFIFSTNVTGTYGVALSDGPSVSKTFLATFSATAGTPVKVTIPIASLPTSLNTSQNASLGLTLSIGALNAGTYSSATTGSWIAGQFVTASSATNWGATAANFISATQIKLESGTVATPWVPLPFVDELLQCQRYYWTSYDGVAAGTATTVGALTLVVPVTGSTGFASWEFPVSMRAAPTLTFYSSSGASGVWRAGGSSDVSTGNGGIAQSARAFTVNNVGSINAGTAFFGHVVANSEL